MNEFRADLHCHSTCSDGTFSPEELVKHAHEIGLKGLAITDHDTTAAFALAEPTAKSLGIDLITGIEFSAFHYETSIHILGYSYDPENSAIQELCHRQTIRRNNRNALILEKLDKLRFPVTMEEVIALAQTARVIGRPHIAQVMVKKGYVRNVQEAFRKFLGDGKRAFVPSSAIGIQETIDAIHNGNGLAVLAHPHLIVKQKVLRQLLEMNFDGLECYYSRFPREKNQKWIDIVVKKGWLSTGGSDFHGEVKPETALGCAWTDYASFQKIKKI